MCELLDLLRDFSVGECIRWLGWVDHLKGLNARVEKTSKVVDEFLEDIIEEHKQKEKGSVHDVHDDDFMARSSDFVDILLQVQKENWTKFHVEHDTLKALILVTIYFPNRTQVRHYG